jgi:Zn-dependent protease
MFFSLNLILGVFNLLPLPPLDGSTGLTLFLKEETATAYQDFIAQPMLGGMGLLLAWNIFAPLSRPLFLTALNLLYP